MPFSRIVTRLGDNRLCICRTPLLHKATMLTFYEHVPFTCPRHHTRWPGRYTLRTWFAPRRGPLMGCIYPRGLPVVAWVLHESGYSLLVLELWPWSHFSLLFVTVLGYVLTWRHLTLATPSLGDASSWRRLILTTPHLGDAFSWRRPILVTPYLGNASSGQSVDFLLWTPRVVPLYVDFDLTVEFDFGQRPGMGRYINSPRQSINAWNQE